MHARHRVGGYAEFAPAPGLAHVCEAVWIHRTARGPAIPGAAHRVLPDLAVSLAFQTFRDDAGRPIAGGPIIVGPKLRPQIFNLVPGRELAAIRLKPEWVAPMLGVDPSDVEDLVADLATVRPALAERLQDALWRTRSAEEALGVLASVAMATPASQARPSPAAVAALEIVRRTAGRLPCEQLAGRVGVSARHLRRQVCDSTGVSPKVYARVLRFTASIRMADASVLPAWADIAARAGYCDQSHLIRDSIALTGTAPQDLFQERRRQVVATATATATATD